MKKPPIAVACIAMLLVPSVLNAETPTVKPTPKPTTASQPAAAPKPAVATQQIQIETVPQICRLREREIVNLNLQIFGRNAASLKETDEAKRKDIVTQAQNLLAALREAESSWSRLDCARILYGAR